MVRRRPERKPRPGNWWNNPGSPNSGGSNETSVPPVPPTPSSRDNTIFYETSSVKPATPDLIIFEEELVEIDAMTDLLFEDIGGQELINIARNDIINGQSIIYQPIKNVNQLANKYNPQNILYIPQTAYSFFNNFPLKFVNYLPNEGNGPNGESTYLDEEGNLIINLVNVKPNEEAEVQVFDRPNIFNDTIYEGEL